jgi:hypothetical protein
VMIARDSQGKSRRCGSDVLLFQCAGENFMCAIRDLSAAKIHLLKMISDRPFPRSRMLASIEKSLKLVI